METVHFPLQLPCFNIRNPVAQYFVTPAIPPWMAEILGTQVQFPIQLESSFFSLPP